MTEYKLTEYSHSSGCGCKIAPDVLEKILQGKYASFNDAHLLVGNDTKDDAAVYDLGNGTALISTVDFFMPIVDDAFSFGQIAAANAISDIYAMGGKPILATAILGWPVSKLPPELAGEVINGAKEKCAEAGIVLAGGHSIDSPEPFFGLSVNGIVKTDQLKKNSGAKLGDLIYITKKIGSGILATALKRKVIAPEHEEELIQGLKKLNTIGTILGTKEYVTALTDVTGFGLLGHLIEMMDGANLSAEINYSAITLMNGVAENASKMIVPDNLYRNWNSYEKKVKLHLPEAFFSLCDPQTNGGLLLTINPTHQSELEDLLKQNGLEEFAKPIGITRSKSEIRVEVK
ncbi:MAG: selenide, water dikinase SelD [Bacteroidota bacterium]|nr:selenide, water dikinase SelD [Bacteroidota bacterium]